MSRFLLTPMMLFYAEALCSIKNNGNGVSGAVVFVSGG